MDRPDELLRRIERERAQLRAVLDNMAEGVIISDTDGNVVEMNPEALRLLGFDNVEDARRNLKEWPEYELRTLEGDPIPLEDWPLARVTRGERFTDVRVEVHNTSTGMVGIWSYSGAPVHDERGRVILTVMTERDITETVRVEQRIRESEQHYRGLFETMTEGVAMHKMVYGSAGEPVDYVIEDVNRAYEAIVGVPRDQAVGKLATELYGTAEAPYLDVYAKVAATGVPASFETYFPPMGKHFSISVFTPHPGEFATVFADITERKRTEAELQQRDAAIRRAYADVVDAVTGGKLVLMTPDEILSSLGEIVLPPQPIEGGDHLCHARKAIKETLSGLAPLSCAAEDCVLAASEAMTNALKHGGGGWYEVRRTPEAEQTVVTDHGPGIDFHTLPKATLVPGFSTKQTLGMGFTIMLDVCDRLLLTTQTGLTSIVLETAFAKVPEA